MAREIHNWRQVIFIIQLFFGFPQSKYPVLPQSCIKGIWGVRDFCFWVFWDWKKVEGRLWATFEGIFFHVFGVKRFFLFFKKKHYSVHTKKLHNTFFIKCCWKKVEGHLWATFEGIFFHVFGVKRFFLFLKKTIVSSLKSCITPFLLNVAGPGI